MRLFKPTTVIILLLLLSVVVVAQQKKTLQLEDYKDWNRISNTALSPNGEWMTYSYSPNEGDATFYIRKINADTVYSNINAKRISFSDNNQWVAFLVDPAKEEAEKLRKQKQSVNSTLHIYNLSNNTVEAFKDVRAFSLSENSAYIAIHKVKSDKDAEHAGSDLILKNLNSDRIQNIGNVSSFAFNKKGDVFAYLVDADGDAGNGVYAIDMMRNSTHSIHTGAYTYSQLTWNEAGKALAVLFGEKPEGKVQRENTLLVESDILSISAAPIGQQLIDSSDLPGGHVISEYRSLSWNEAGSQIFFGIKAQSDEVKKDDMLKANVDVFHWKDEVVQSRQMITANQDKRATHVAVLNLRKDNVIQLANDDMSFVRTNNYSNWAVASVDKPYRAIRNRPSGYADLQAINTVTGAKDLIAEDVYQNMGISPKGDYAVYSRDGRVMVYNFETKLTNEITKNSDVFFQNREFDRPVEKPTYGIAGWSDDGKWLLLNHKYDIYAFSLNSKEVLNVTHGMGNENDIRFRLTQLDPEANRYDVSKPLLLSAYGEWTKKSGYYEVQVGKKPKALMFADKMIGRPSKAKDADVIAFTQQTFEQFPNYWVSGTDFKKPQQITDANPQQSEFKWGRRLLVDYTDKRGHKLQATLALPADYEKGKKYPMVIYFYEKMSQRHHQYSQPTYDDRPHMSTYASNGYLVLMPDIIYDDGLPGSSALDDVTAAAQAVIDLGYADSERIGLQGHSWGGYESKLYPYSNGYVCLCCYWGPTY